MIAGLDRTYLDAVDEAYQKHDGDQLTERETKDFVLMHCFGIVPKLIKTPVDLLKVLLSLHSRKVRLPDFLDRLPAGEPDQRRRRSQTWPLADILPSREKFPAVPARRVEALPRLSERSASAEPGAVQPRGRAGLHRHVLPRRVADAGRAGERRQACPPGCRPGVIHDPEGRRPAPVPWPAAEVRGGNSQRRRVAPGMAAGGAALGRTGRPALGVGRGAGRRRPHGLERLAGEGRGRLRPVDDAPLRLAAQPAVPPAAGHGPPDFPLPGGRADTEEAGKIALLVLDGLAFDQWLLLRKNLEACDKAWRFQESTAFAWVPTLTSVTRQSIFAGEPPLYFPDSLETTSKEKIHWLRFWEDQGVQRAGVELVTNLDGPDDPKLEAALANSSAVGPGDRLEQGR